MKALIAAVLVLTCATLAFAAEPEAKKAPPAPAEYLVGEVHYQTLPDVQYLSAGSVTTFDKMVEVVDKYLPKLREGIGSGAIIPRGSCLFVYKGITEDMSKPFTLEIGWVVGDKAKDVGDFKVRKVDGGKCATLLFTGRMTDIAKAYEKLIPTVTKAGHTPTGESRELYLYWEGMDSPNNVVQLQLPLK